MLPDNHIKTLPELKEEDKYCEYPQCNSESELQARFTGNWNWLTQFRAFIDAYRHAHTGLADHHAGR